MNKDDLLPSDYAHYTNIIHKIKGLIRNKIVQIIIQKIFQVRIVIYKLGKSCHKGSCDYIISDYHIHHKDSCPITENLLIFHLRKSNEMI